MLCEWCGGNVARKDVAVGNTFAYVCLACWYALQMLPDDWESQEHAAKEKE